MVYANIKSSVQILPRIRQKRNGLHETKPAGALVKQTTIEINTVHMPQTKDRKTNNIYQSTSKFLVLSSQKSRYIMVLCEIDGNLVLVELMKSRT